MGIQLLYLISTILSFVMLFINIARNQKIDAKYMALEIVIAVTCLGRFILSTAQTLETAVWANKLLYFGAIFAPLLLLMVSAQVCNVSFPNWIKRAGIIMSAVIYGFVLTIGYSPLYYRDVELRVQNGYSYLVKSYGPLHTLYPLQLMVYCALLTVLVVRVVKKRKSVPMLPVVSLGVVGIITIVIYFLERLLHSTVEWLCLPYIASSVLMTFWQDRVNMYDISLNVASTVDRMKDYGYIVFDKRSRFVNANQFAKEIFPEIRDWKVDLPVEREDSLAYREIVSQLRRLNREKTDLWISTHGRYVKIQVRDIFYHRKKPVGYLVEILDMTLEQMYTKTVENYNSSLERQVKEKTADILQMKDSLLKSIAIMVESRDDNTGSHIFRTSEVVQIFAGRLQEEGFPGLTPEFLEMVVKAAPLHDLGKISVSDAILQKRGKFTPEEYHQMQMHSEAGAEMVGRVLKDSENAAFIQIAKNIAHYHHEKWDGTGYPAHLAGESIPIEARIMAFADVFDALSSQRCYKEAFPVETSLQIIEKDLGSHFDPALGKVFLTCREELFTLYR